MSEPAYDSRADTLEHIAKVRGFLDEACLDLIRRAREHDASKLASPEKEYFDEFTPKLRATTYMSPEYQALLDGLRPALDHHYASTRHHPESHEGGIRGMSLLDLLEMFCDWLAATSRHADGDIRRSIEVNQGRFGYSDELKRILHNTADDFGRRPRGGDEVADGEGS